MKITLYHNKKYIKTISDFVSDNNIVLGAEELFEQNRSFIFSQMSATDKRNYAKKNNLIESVLKETDIDYKMDLPFPCKILIDNDKVTKELSISQINISTDTDDYYGFLDDEILKITQNVGYTIDNFNKREVECNVLGWFKSMYFLGEGYDRNGKNVLTASNRTGFVNISDHITEMSTFVDENGGNFTIVLPIIPLKENPITFFNGDNQTSFEKNIISKSFISREKNSYYVKTEDPYNNYFEQMISSNDLLLISFEKLEMEFKRGEFIDIDEDILSVSTDASSNVYDMIGLVDTVETTYNVSDSSGYVTIRGRDLIKLLIDDGSYFFPVSYSNGINIFQNKQNEGDISNVHSVNGKTPDPFNRLRGELGNLLYVQNRMNMRIDYILKTVISDLANIEVVPGYVFKNWSNKTQFIDLLPKEETNVRK